MAKTVDIELRLDRDQQFVFTILNQAETAAVDITGWATSFMVKRNKSDADVAALVTKTNAAISGTYNSDPDVNTQVATVTIEDSDCLSTVMSEGLYYYEFERTTAGSETPLVEGTCEAILGVQR